MTLEKSVMSENLDTNFSIKLSVNEENILNLLASNSTEELYGLNILRRLNSARERTGEAIGHPRSIVEIKYKNLYPILNRLENKRLISWRWGDADEKTGGARRKYYRITSFGKRVLLEQSHFKQAIADMYGAPAYT